MTESHEPQPTPLELDRVEDVPRILKVMRKAVREALPVDKKLGNPVAVWQEGRVVWIPPEEIPTDVVEPNAEGE